MRRACPAPLCAGLLALGACGGDAVPQQDDGRPPNLILISLDTLRAGHMSVYGYERDTTPNLARFAAGATVYDTAIASSCWTLIAHMSMLTGFYPEQHGVVDRKLALGPEAPLLAERLYAEGYQTLGIYKPGWVHERFGSGRGFEVFRGHEDGFEAGTNLAEELDRLRPNRPFFLFLHLFDIHPAKVTEPDDPYYDPPAPWDELFVPDARARLADVDFTEARLDRDDPLTPEQLEALIGLYDGGIAWVDSLLGEWLADWERRGLLANTLVIINADHGEALGQRGHIKGHGAMYQDALHIPLIVRYPDAYLAGQRVARPVSHVDIVPTALDCLGFEVDPRLPGYSLLRDWPAERVIRSAKPPSFACIQWPIKVLGSGSARSSYDLEQDPLETRWSAGHEHHARLEAAFEAEFAERPWVHFDVGRAGKSDRRLERDLAALGYAGELAGDDGAEGGPDSDADED